MHAILTVIGQGRIHYEKILSVREKILDDASAEFNIIFPWPNILHRDETVPNNCFIIPYKEDANHLDVTLY